MWCNCAYKVAYSSWYKRWWMAESHLCVTGGNNKMISVCKTKKGEKANRKKKKVTKKQIALVDPGSKRRKRGKGWREREGGERRPFRQTARRSCCTVGCYVWECLNRDPGRARSGAGRAWRTSGGRGRPQWQRGGGSSAEQSHLEITHRNTHTRFKISKNRNHSIT